MITEARAVDNPIQVGKFRCEIPGYDPFLITSLTLPDSEVEEIPLQSGGQTIPAKHLGGHKGFKFAFETILPASGELRDYLWRQHKKVWTRNKSEWAFDMDVYQLGPDDNPVIKHVFEDVGLRRRKGPKLDSTNDKDLVKEEWECTCDNYDQVMM